jgi:hypothetical protein
MPVRQQRANADVDFWQHFGFSRAARAAHALDNALSDFRPRLRSSPAAVGLSLIPIVATVRTFAEIRTVPSLSIGPGVTVIPTAWISAAAVTFALAAGLAVLLSRRRAIGQTTLAAAWWWSLVAVVGWAGAELVASFSATNGASAGIAPLRLAAIALSLCPIVAVLGAKRPQHKAWNFVVLSLWGIMALPAAETFFLHRGERVVVGDIRGWFLWILVLLGPINFIPTRYWLASLVLAAGQVVALSPHLALLRGRLFSQPEVVGLVLTSAGLVVAWLASRRAMAAVNPYDRLWLDFRDTFGLFWGLRVQERVNAAARQQGWDFELTWSGLRQRADGASLAAIDASLGPTLRTTIKGLLRRFVSNRWIAERAGTSSPDG